MNAKLHIDIPQGVLDVEGDEKFVQSIYEDFKSNLSQKLANLPGTASAAGEPNVMRNDASSPQERKRKPSIRRNISPIDGGKGKGGVYVPKFNSNLDLGKLESFYAQFDPKTHREKILIFAVFMRNILKQAPCTADDIYSCYRTLSAQTEIPEAFVQAIRDAQNKGGYVEFVSPTEIKISIAGENYFNQKLKRKEAAK